MSSIKDVASLAGVSIATVSRVLNKSSFVSPEIMTRVQKAVNDLNYRPNKIAQNLRSQHSNIIGLIVADIINPFYTQLARSVENTARKYGYTIFLCNADENAAKEEEYLYAMSDEQILGAIIAPTKIAAKTIDSYANKKFHIVTYDRPTSSRLCDQLLLDNPDASFRLTEHLITQGRKNIAAIFHNDSPTGKERLKGYKQALAKHNIPYQEELTRFVLSQEEDGYSAAKSLFSSQNNFDAIFTTNALLGAGAFRYMKEHNVEIPNRIAFASFDDASWMELVSPTVTTLRQPTWEIGEMSVELLRNRIHTPAKEQEILKLSGKLIERESTSCRKKAQ